MKWADGSTYEGGFDLGAPHGQGKCLGGLFLGEYIWRSGHEYRGDWVSGVKEGFGVFTWPDGRTYQGYYKDD